MRSQKYIFLFIVIVSYMSVLAQMQVDWETRYNGAADDNDIANAIAVDDSGNVYVTGVTGINGVTTASTTIKYYSNGEIAWQRDYIRPGTSWNEGRAIAMDDSGNVYVAGESFYDYVTIKYYPNGDTAWVRIYNGTGNSSDAANSITLDVFGNVYVTGRSVGNETFSDYLTIKYFPNGDTGWTSRYNGPGNFDDMAAPIAVDSFGNIYVTGLSWDSATHFDYATIKYYPNGDTAWVRRYSSSGYVYDVATNLDVDDSGYIYVTGESSFDYATIKYNPSGDTVWVRRYGTEDGEDFALALAIDYSKNVYVTGGSSGDYATIKYFPNGDTDWVSRYNGSGNSSDAGTHIAIDDSGNVYVTGNSVGSWTSIDYTTIKYYPNGDTAWVVRYNGTGNHNDGPTGLAVDRNRAVYVTGWSDGMGTANDYATIKYKQCVAGAGDANSDNKILLSDIVTVVNFLFKSQPPPSPLCRADANGDGSIVLGDITYLINFIFKAGSSPKKSSTCCL